MQREKERNVKFNYLINLKSFSDADLENDPIQFQNKEKKKKKTTLRTCAGKSQCRLEAKC